MPMQTAKPGFTMIELLVVVLILAILITVIIGVSHAVIARGKAEATRKNMQLVLLGIDAFAETDASKAPPVERTAFPTMNGVAGDRGSPTPADFAAANPNDLSLDGNKNWMAFLRAKALSQQLIGGTEKIGANTNQYFGNAAAKAKVGNAPTAAVAFSYSDTDGLHIGNQSNMPQFPLFVDAYGDHGKYMDYFSNRGAGSTPLLISAGPDGKFGTEDDIRSDRR